MLLLLFLVPAILFLLTQQNTLKLIQPLNRTMRPGQIWLQLIPVFNLYYQFVVVAGISDSLQREFNSYFNDSDSILPDATVTEATGGKRPTYSAGLAYCWLFVGSTVLNWFGTSVSIVAGLAALAAMVCWIVYWVQLAGYKKKLKTMAPA
ncbi:hypothetical protein ACQ86N_19910 [Puia sp. P3]|uniref:hypothetical protein n=1 Tax=Puia sp. P3 TaxID=3423952 RepID=UPI003D664151